MALFGLVLAGAAPASAGMPLLVLCQAPVEGPLDVPPGGLYLHPDTALGACRLVVFDPNAPTAPVRVLTPDFAAAADPDVSFDGQRVLFAGRKAAGDPWDIWEIGVDGSGLRRLTNTPGDCREPIYTGLLNTLDAPPWDQILFVSDDHGTWDEDGRRRSTALYTCKLDGSEVHRVTYNLSSDFSPYALHDSRVLFTSRQRVNGRYPPAGLLPLMTILNDGCDMMPFHGNHEGPLLRHQARETPDGHVVFIESDGTTWCGGGALSQVAMSRPLYSRQPLADDAVYHFPCPLPEGGMIVSCRGAKKGDYGLYHFDRAKRKRGKVLFDVPEYHELDAQPVVERPKPRGRSTVVNYAKDTSWLFCLDAYLSDRPEAATIAPGDIKRLRIIEGLPASATQAATPTGIAGPEGGAVFDRRRLIADVPVEKDGSFNLLVPPMTPFHLQTVGADGQALQTLRSWIWNQPMECRGCVGCHEDREMVPPNRFVQAAGKKAFNLNLAPAMRRTVDFRDDVMPLIEANCLTAHCHGEGGAKPYLGGGLEPVAWGGEKPVFNQAYVNLLTGLDKSGRPFVTPGSARTSSLIAALAGAAGEKGVPPHPAMPPEQLLAPFDRQTFVEWVDLGARWSNRTDGGDAP